MAGSSCCCSGNPGVTQREMEVLQESVLARGRPEQSFKALLVNFKKLQAASNPPPTAAAELECSWEELLHAVAGMCCVALPDMEETAVYSSLTRSGSKTIILLANTEKTHHQNCKEGITAGSVGSDGVLGSSGVSRTVEETTDCSGDAVTQASSGSTGNSIDNLERSFHEVFSESESSECESVEGDGEFREGKRQFLEACRSRRQRGELRRGPEEMVAGCGCFLRLSDRSLASAVQVLLLVVRRRWRKSGLGSFLLQTMKDPAVVGHYDTLLTFADRKAERFFATHDFSDDPILTAKYREMVDQWENSSLMAYIPPFSGNETSNMAALTLCEDSYKNWRHTAIASYCEQLSSMQRLRHEVMLLHSKLESREAEIERLKQQLVQAEREKSVTELEFSNYRKHTQKLLCESVVDKTQKWLESEQYSTN